MLYAFKLILVVNLITVGEFEDSYDSIIETLRTAEVANEERYPQGSMTVDLRRGQTDLTNSKNDQHEQITAHVKWLGNTIFTDLTSITGNIREVDSKRFTPLKMQVIYDQKKAKLTKVVYLDDHPYRVFITNAVPGGIEREHQLTPKAFWYNAQVLDVLRALDLFDKSTIKSDDVTKVKLSYERIGSKVHLIRNDGKNHLDAWFDLGLDGNVTKIHLNEPDNQTQTRDLQWTKTTKGDVFLEKASSSREIISHGRKIAMYEEIKIKDFDPYTKVSANQLTLKSLDLEQVTVEDQTTQRSYRIGKISRQTLEDKWNRLIESMKASGFSTKQRE